MSYRRNLFAVTAASFIGFMGFTLVMQTSPRQIRFIDSIHASQADNVTIRF